MTKALARLAIAGILVAGPAGVLAPAAHASETTVCPNMPPPLWTNTCVEIQSEAVLTNVWVSGVVPASVVTVELTVETGILTIRAGGERIVQTIQIVKVNGVPNLEQSSGPITYEPIEEACAVGGATCQVGLGALPDPDAIKIGTLDRARLIVRTTDGTEWGNYPFIAFTPES